jgi:O-methyltransferase involved in polyketide biosynthesis
MDPGRASWTARSAAYMRAYDYANHSPRVFEDFLAGTLLTPEERDVIENSWLAGIARLSPELASAGERAAALAQRGHIGCLAAAVVVGRARYNEDKLSEAIRRGISQYVIVGTGLDTSTCFSDRGRPLNSVGATDR